MWHYNFCLDAYFFSHKFSIVFRLSIWMRERERIVYVCERVCVGVWKRDKDKEKRRLFDSEVERMYKYEKESVWKKDWENVWVWDRKEGILCIYEREKVWENVWRERKNIRERKRTYLSFFSVGWPKGSHTGILLKSQFDLIGTFWFTFQMSRGCWRSNINFIFWPHCYDRHVVSFLFS